MIGCIPCEEVFGDKAATQSNSEQMYWISLVIAHCLKQMVKTCALELQNSWSYIACAFGSFLPAFITSLRYIHTHFGNMEGINIGSPNVNTVLWSFRYNLKWTIISSHTELFKVTEFWCILSSFIKKNKKIKWNNCKLHSRCAPDVF